MIANAQKIGAAPSEVEAERAYIAQMRIHADVLEENGETVSAERWRRAADYSERVLNEKFPPAAQKQESAQASEEIEGDEDDYGLAAMVSNCPCGRSFRGADFDHVCPSCRVTLREAWRRRGTRPPTGTERDDDS